MLSEERPCRQANAAHLIPVVDDCQSSVVCENVVAETIRNRPAEFEAKGNSSNQSLFPSKSGSESTCRKPPRQVDPDFLLILSDIHAKVGSSKRKHWETIWRHWKRLEPRFCGWCKNSDVLRTTYHRHRHRWPGTLS